MGIWRLYNRKSIPAEMFPYIDGQDLSAVSIGDDDRDNGSPKEGDMIARDPSNHGDMWLVNASYFAEKFDATPID